MHDILIRGGMLFDGSGLPGVASDLAIDGACIAAIGYTGAAREIIPAEGLAVAPGFIDIKTHSDFTLPINPKAKFARASPQRSSVTAAFRSRPCYLARSTCLGTI
jgi:N-acyl-D-amino-acid deacylase